MLRKGLWVLLLSLLTTVPCGAKTLVISGRISSEVTVTQQVTFGVDQKISELVYRFPMPASVQVPSLSQRLTGQQITFEPQPVSVKDERDAFGNYYKVVTWRSLSGDARANISFTTDLDATLSPMVSKSPFPLGEVPEEQQLYLKPTAQVQSADPKVVSLAAELTAGTETEWAAVDAILNFVTDHIHYQTPPKSYDALHGLTTGTGNCQNFAHLSCALLRAAGIPARVAVGLTLKDKWKIPLDDRGSSLVQGMGEGLHAWIEVWFPGLGWLPCDPQQSKQFTSTRHIKYAHGPECAGIGTTWRSAPVLPRYASTLSSNYSRDDVALKLKSSGSEPRDYMAASEMIATAPVAPVKPPVVPPVSPLEQQRLAEKVAAEQKLAQQRLAEQKLAEQKLAELRLAEKRLAEQRLAEQKLAAQRLAEKRLAEKRLAEQKLAQQKLAEQRFAEQRLVEKRLAEKRLAEQKLAERRLAEQKLAEQRLAEQRVAEKRLAEQLKEEQRLAEKRLAEQKLAEQRLAEQRLAEKKLAEKRLAEQKLAQQKLAEERLAAQQLADQRLAEQRLAELLLAEQKLVQQRLAEQKREEQQRAECKLAEERLAAQKLAEQKLAEQRLAEQKLVEQQRAERKLAEERLAAQKLAEQKLSEERLAEQRLAEQRLAEQKLAEQRLAEQKLAEKQLAEQRLAEQKLADQRLAEQKLAEQRLAEQRAAEQKLAEQRLAEQKLAEQKLADERLAAQRLAEQRAAEEKLAEKRLAELKLAQKLATPQPKPAQRPPRKPAGPPPLVPDSEGRVVFGNQSFPATLDLYTQSGNRGEASLEQETAEYVTSGSVYAQAFHTDRPLKLEKVSLAAKKFGGDGTVYLDIVADDHGKPGLTSGVRSQPVYLEKVRRQPGYAWLDFVIPEDSDPFPAGKYWVVLRRSGEAIVNWWYTPGKSYGGPDDTRSTARGWQWEDILTYDFVFKVAGREVR